MKKLLCAVLSLTMLIALLSGCSLFASKEGNTESTDTSTQASEGGEENGSKGVKITDSYSFSDPEGLDFDTRHVVVCGENSVVVTSDTMVTYGVQNSYYVIYGKDGQTIALYDLYVCDTKENAQGLLQFYVNDGNTVIRITDEDPTVLCNENDPDKLVATVTMLADAGLMSGTDAKAYADFCVASYGGVLVE